MLSPQFSKVRPVSLKAVFQYESFDAGLIRVRESLKFTTGVTSTYLGKRKNK